MLKIGSLSGPTWEEVARRFAAVLPPNPLGPRSLPAQARLEGPPRLDAREKHRWPLRLVRSYRSVATHWFGPCGHHEYKRNGRAKRQCDGYFCWVADSLDPSDVGAPIWRHLVRAADQLHERKWAPITWAAFSCQTWAKYGRAKQFRPHIVWVYSKTRIDRGGGVRTRDQDLNFFDWACSARFPRDRIVSEDLHREVYFRWARAKGALRVAYAENPNMTDDEALDVIKQDFDPAWYGGACERIEALARKREDAWWVRRQRDEWLWS